MKAMALYLAVFTLALLCIPMIAMNFEVPDVTGVPVHSPAPPESGAVRAVVEESAPVPAGPAGEREPPADTAEESAETGEIPATGKGTASFRILDESTGEVREVSLRDYVRGAVAAEMPASFHSEALKAQAVAAHTYALHNHLVQQDSPDPALKGADFSADPSNMLVYITEETARSFYGDKADRYWKKICTAADEVLRYVLEYEDEPIVAAYHAISAGRTEDAGNVWSGSAPYLRAVESAGDILAPDFESLVTVPPEELRSLLVTACPGIRLPENPEEWFGGMTHSSSGYVLSVDVGDQTLHGKDVRQLLDLRSHNFEVQYTERGFEFTVLGYGHGVGLSQYGADYLARQGYAFDEILAAYYTGAALKQIGEELIA